MKKTIKTNLTLLCSLLLLTTLFACTSSTNNNVDNEIEEIIEETKTKVDDNIEIVIVDNYVEFGSYPQKEIVSKPSDSGVHKKDFETEDDYIIDESLYNTLKNLSDDNWDANGDTTIDNNSYRRIKEDDATKSTTNDINYYDWSNTNEYHYFKYEPIKWRVLKQNDNEALLLSDIAIDTQMYHTEIKKITWEVSTIRSWLNGYDGTYNALETDYSNDNFINTAFTSKEQSMILETAISNNDNVKSGTEGGNDTKDKVFFLSEEEIYGSNASEYGFNEDYDAHDLARQAKSSTYAKAMGAYVECESEYLGNCFYWLRSPGSHPGLFILVRCNGSVYRGGQHADSKSRGVRPAIRINLTNN